MDAIIYTAIFIVSLAILFYVAMFILLLLGNIWEYLQDEVLSDPVGRLFIFITGALFTAGTILYFLEI